LAKSDPLGFLLKMLLVTSTWGSTRCLLTWKQTVTQGGRSLFRLVQSTPRTSASESGSWLATATATANQTCPSMQKWKGCREIWPTPTARDWKDGSAQACQNVPANGLLGRVVHFYPTMDYGAAKGWGSSSAEDRSRLGGSLNPEWVEWLMGYPAGWTDLGDSGTRSFRKSSRKLAEPSSPPSATVEAAVTPP
jgi:hypothetical protein